MERILMGFLSEVYAFRDLANGIAGEGVIGFAQEFLGGVAAVCAFAASESVRKYGDRTNGRHWEEYETLIVEALDGLDPEEYFGSRLSGNGFDFGD